MAYPPPDELARHVPPEDYARFKAQINRLSIPENVVKNIKPFGAASTLMFTEWERNGFSPQYCIDAYVASMPYWGENPALPLGNISVEAAPKGFRLLTTFSGMLSR